MLVGNLTLPDSVLDSLFQEANLLAGTEVEGCHDLLTSDGILPGAVVVAGLEVDELLAHELEVVEKVLLLLLIGLVLQINLNHLHLLHILKQHLLLLVWLL